jgi:hypothetical protein
MIVIVISFQKGWTKKKRKKTRETQKKTPKKMEVERDGVLPVVIGT